MTASLCKSPDCEKPPSQRLPATFKGCLLIDTTEPKHVCEYLATRGLGARELEVEICLQKRVKSIATQREAKRDGSISIVRIQRLEPLVGWTWDALADNWESMFSSLVEYVQGEGHARVPLRCKSPDGTNLGNWVIRQRMLKKEGKLDFATQEKLQALTGWSWDLNEEQFQDGLMHLGEYRLQFGNPNVPQRYRCEDGFALGHWVSNRRMAYKRNALPQNQIEALESISGWIWIPRNLAAM